VNYLKSRGAAIARVFTQPLFAFSRRRCTSLHDNDGLGLGLRTESFILKLLNGLPWVE
jgi:hypothetical protein